jgi:hypothetical protein
VQNNAVPGAVFLWKTEHLPRQAKSSTESAQNDSGGFAFFAGGKGLNQLRHTICGERAEPGEETVGVLVDHFSSKNDQFTKTGSGQT